MKHEFEYFKTAMPLAQYMDQMTKLKEETFQIYNNFQVDSAEPFIQDLKKKNVSVLVITEDWCGDAMINNPILRRIAEAADVDVRCVFRDENPELIDAYLTNGGRAIPIYIFLSAEGKVLGSWGTRAPELQQYVMERRASDLPEKDAPDFAERQTAMYASIREENVKDERYWTYVYNSLKEAFIALP